MIEKISIALRKDDMNKPRNGPRKGSLLRF